MSDRSRLRLFVLRVLVVSLLATLFGRLWILQVSSAHKYVTAAAENRIRDVITPATRGLILDDTGAPLVRNRTALVVSVDRTVLGRQKDGGRAVLARLAPIVGMPVSELRKRIRLCGPKVKQPCWNGSPYQPIPVKQFPPSDAARALAIKEQQEMFPGVSTSFQAVRDYPRPAGANAAHILGYLSPISAAEIKKATYREDLPTDLVGRAGLEETYDAWLRGASGVRRLAVDHLGNVTQVLQNTAPKPGDSLVTSLNARVQRVLEDALAGAMANAHQQGSPADSAAGVILDAQTGHVVAIASLPTYQPDIWVGGISSRDYAALTNPAAGTPLLDRSVQGQFAPGSTFKLVTTAGVVKEGEASFNGSYDCPPELKVGNAWKHNFEGESYGYIDLFTTIKKSCDTVYYKFAIDDWYRDEAIVKQHRTPIEAVARMARGFGLGTKTGVDLPGEAAGSIVDRASKLRDWKTWVRPNACAGAKHRPKGSYLQQLDAENCVDGWKLRLGDLANEYIGQGEVLVTPLQLAAAYGALVDGGKVYSPQIGKAVLRPNGSIAKIINCRVRGRVPVNAAVLADIRAAMYEVVQPRGTAGDAFAGFPFSQVAVGGKTGTAEVHQNEADTSWFASFAGRPGQPAQYVAVVMVTKGGQGGLVAAPAMRQIWDGIYGLEGHHAALPGGSLPRALPRVAPDGRIEQVR